MPSMRYLYRVHWRWFGWEPQMRYNTGKGKMLWFPLNAEGYWLEMDAYTEGKITKRIRMSWREAKRAVLRAQAINQHHIKGIHP